MKSPISGSKLAVGSSRRRISGLLIKDLARETLFFWPDESSPVFLSKNSFISKSLEISFILFFQIVLVQKFSPLENPSSVFYEIFEKAEESEAAGGWDRPERGEEEKNPTGGRCKGP